MKTELSPAVVGVVVVIILAVVGFFMWRGTKGSANLPTGTTQQGNRGKGPIFEWMNKPPGSQAAGAPMGQRPGGPPGGVSAPGAATAGTGAPR